MLPYWIIFLIPAIGTLSPVRLHPAARGHLLWLSGLCFTLVIGLRNEVGADWYNYFKYLEAGRVLSLWEVLQHGDPGYYLLNWISTRMGGGIYLVNTLCAAFTMAGVVRFAKRQPLPWLALLIAVPYLIVVVAMGYTRQAAALGFVLLGLVALGDAKMRTFVFWVLIGAAFHKSAVLVLPVAALSSSQNRIWSMAWIGVMSLLGGYLFLFDSVNALWENYVEADYQSQGGFIRVMMNAVPAMLYLLLHQRLSLGVEEQRLWWWMSILAMVCIPLVVISSTATDRVALYLIPLQIYMFSRLHRITKDPLWRALTVLGVVAYYATVLAVWLFFASHAFAWLPYQNIIFATASVGM